MGRPPSCIPVALARLLLFLAWRGASASSCTGVPKGMQPGTAVNRTLVVHDQTGRYTRRYSVHIPSGYTGFQRTPALFYFHGWAEQWPCQHCEFHAAGNKHGFITVMPEGMEDGQPGWRSWNVLASGRRDVCTAEALPKNYSSCYALNETGPCNCYTCHDDVQFVADLAKDISDTLCIDQDNLFATGASNGAMFLYSLAPALADRGLLPRFKAIIPYYGAVFENMESVQHTVSGTAIFHHHGTRDVTIPPNGGESYDHWLYVPINKTLTKYALANGCSDTTEEVKTPWDTKEMLMGCVRFQGCQQQAVVHCTYNESHGFWESYQVEMLWWQVSSLLPHAHLAYVV